jgi:hypothetical protein
MWQCFLAAALGSSLVQGFARHACRLVDRVVAPWHLVESAGKLRLDAIYYITKQVL